MRSISEFLKKLEIEKFVFPFLIKYQESSTIDDYFFFNKFKNKFEKLDDNNKYFPEKN